MTSRAEIAEAFANGPHDHVPAGDGSLAHWSFGDGPDLVFIHGWPLHGATWRNVIAEFSTDYRCHAFDLPGVNHSTWPADAPVGLWPNAHALVEAIQSLGIERFAFFAHDSGATITRLATTLMPDRVVANIMGNTEITGHVPRVFVIAQKLMALPGAPSALGLLSKSKTLQRSIFGFKECFHDVRFIDGDFGRFFAERASDPDYIAGQLRYVDGIDWDVVRDLAPIHAAITSPVVMIWGAADAFFPLKLARPMLDEFAGDSHLETIGDGKLFVHEEYAVEFAALARPYIEEQAATVDGFG